MEFAQKVQIAVEHILFAFELDLGAAKLGKKNLLSDGDRHWDQGAVLEARS